MEKEKQVILMRKTHDKAYLHKMLIENEENKQKQLVNLQREREDDVRACEEYARVLDKQEKDRENYFKNKEKRSNEFSKKMSDTVIKDMEEKQIREEQNIRKYVLEK